MHKDNNFVQCSPAPGPVPSPAPGPVPNPRPAPSLARARPVPSSQSAPCPTVPAATATAATAATAAPATAATAAATAAPAILHAAKLWLRFGFSRLIMRADRFSLTRAATAPPATADSSTRSQWLTRDAAARIAIRNHLPLTECAHFGQFRTLQALYDAVVARYSSLATASLGHVLLPYLFLELCTFATIRDLVSHLRASDARYRATGPTPPFLCPLPDQSQPPLQPASPLPDPSPYTEQSGGITERREPASRPLSPVRTTRRAPHSRPPPALGTHAMILCPSSVPLRVPLPAPLASSLPEVPDPVSDHARAASPTVSRLLATAVTDPSFVSAAASALVAKLHDFAAACCLDYATALVAESESASPPSVEGECVLGTDVLEDRQEDFECLAAAVPRFASMLLAPEGDLDAPDIPTPRSYAEAITGPYSSQWKAAMDAKMASWKSTGTFVDEVPPPGANIVDGMWIFRVKRPPGSPPAFKARYVARVFSQRQGVDYFHTFSPTPKMTTLRAPRGWHDTLGTTLAALGFAPATADPSLFLRTDTSLPPFYVLVYVDDIVFATADTEALTLVKSELHKRHTCTDLGELRSFLGLQITRDRARRTITLTQSHMVHQVLQRFGFQFSSPQPTPLSTSHSLSAPPSNESVEPSGPYRELVGCLMHLMTCTRPDLAYPLSLLARYVAPGRHRKVPWDAAKRVLRYLCSTSGMGLVLGGRGPVVLSGHVDASWVGDSATQRSSQGYTFSLGSGSVSWRSTRSSLVLSFGCEAKIYAGAMAAQKLRWLTYLLTDLGEQPRSPPDPYIDNKAMIALCQEHIVEYRTKHITLRYFLARDLQQHDQLRLAYVATRANTADVFTKALLPGDHQRFLTVLGLVPTLPHLLTA
ncbi:unnamed protein product [Closterium sp. NIES-54]